MPRACLWFLGKGDRVVDVSHCERWRDASWRALGGKGCSGKGQGQGRRLAEGKGLEVGISGINADSRKGGNVAISPNGEQICNQTNLRYWEIFDPATNVTSYLLSCAGQSDRSFGHPPSAWRVITNRKAAHTTTLPTAAYLFLSITSFWACSYLFTPAPDSCTTFRSSSVSVITYSHSLRENIFENNVY